jgi:2-polyprenyl-3-methyl-5-hydroxy-6-metoxy-1,4-benzoquinol methylase
MNNITSCPVCSNKEFSTLLESEDYFLTREIYNVLECKICGLRFTSPIPDREKLGKYYKSVNYISHSNTRKGFINTLYSYIKQVNLRKKLQIISFYSKAGKLLDIGCGSGAFPAYMKFKGWDVTAVEPDDDARACAAELLSGDVFDEPALDLMAASQYDVITLWHVLEHVYGLKYRMEQIIRLMKDDGVLIIALPNCESYDAKHYGKFWAAYDLPRHLYHFTQQSMDYLSAKYNLEIITKLPMKFDSYYVSLLSEKYKGGNPLFALVNGFRSNMKARTGKQEYSSLIYVLRKCPKHFQAI